MPENPWDKAATEYSQLVDAPGNMCYRALIDPYLRRELGAFRGGRLLDLGCGDGYLSRLLPLSHDISGIDYSEELIRLARQKCPGGDFRLGDISQPLPYGREFDAVVSNMVLMSVADLAGAYSGADAVLKPGGKFVMTILHPIFSRPTMQWFKTWPMKLLRHDPFARIDAYGGQYEKNFSMLGLKSATPLIHRLLAGYVSPGIEKGWRLEKFDELFPTAETLQRYGQPSFLAKFPLVLALIWEKRLAADAEQSRDDDKLEDFALDNSLKQEYDNN